MTSSLERARAAFAGRSWRSAADAFGAAAARAPLTADDHGRRAVAAFLVGDDVTCERAWDDAYRVAVEATPTTHSRAGAASDVVVRSEAASWLGGAPNWRRYSRLNCDALS